MKILHTTKLFFALLLLTSCDIFFQNLENQQETLVPLNSSIALFHEDDYLNCSEYVSKAVKLKNKSLSFVINQYAYVSPKNNQIESFCYMQSNKTCEQMTQEKINSLEYKLESCFKTAKKYDLEVTILPHLDVHDHSIWRNEFIFSPLEKYRGFSYQDVLLRPILNALVNSKIPSEKINFNLQGEMGATVFKYARAYIKVKNQIRKALKKTKIGISLNYNFIDGKLSFSPYYNCQGQYVTESFNNKNTYHLTKREKESLKTLLKEIHFIGISAYGTISESLNPNEFENIIWNFTKELKEYEIQLDKDKEFHFSEVGIGGGAKCYDGKSAAKSYQEALKAPYSGIHSSYAPENPWDSQALRKARMDYYITLGKYLIQKKTFNLTRAYIWNVGSWDFQDLYPGSYKYHDSLLIEWTSKYNEKVQLK